MRKISKLCIVCDQEPPIKNSHVIPKFVFRWMIATGGTKYLRHGASVNKRVQDGIVYPLLCSKCETKASVFEKNFSELVFKPSVDQSLIPKKTGVSEYLFLASVHQRIQAYLKAEGKYQELEQDQKALVDQGIETLGDLLLEKRHSAYPFKIFLFSFGLGDYSHAIKCRRIGTATSEDIQNWI